MPVSIFGSTSNTSLGGAERKVFMNTKDFVKYDAVTESLNMNGNAINNLPVPVLQTDAANRQYVDAKINNLDDELKQYINSVIAECVANQVKTALETLVSSPSTKLY